MRPISPIHRILFAVDLSERTSQIVPVVTRLAQLTGAEVEVLHVWTTQMDHLAELEAPSEVKDLVSGVVDRLRGQGTNASGTLQPAANGGVAEAITAAAKGYAADLVVVGSRGRSSLEGLVLGSVSHKVIAQSDAPVLVVRGGSARRGSAVGRILLAVDADSEMPAAVDATKSIAAAAQAKVCVLHARYLLPSGMRGAYVEPYEDSEALVDGVVRDLRGAGLEASGKSVLARHRVAGEIVDAAKAWDADLIVIGSRRLSDLVAAVLGSTDQAVIRQADRPVLVAGRAKARTRPKPRPHKDAR